jgi:LmbE family N-acetylglucosaminyl deacetylase
MVMTPTVLVVAPHPDDEAIGCGGAICLHRQRGERVSVVFLTSGERGIDGMDDAAARAIREAEAAAATDRLGVERPEFLRLPDLALDDHVEIAAQRLAPVLATVQPSIIYLPHPDDAHPDHQATLPIVQRALAEAGTWSTLPELWAYEVWSPMASYDWPEDISGVMRDKLRAVRCYRSQLQTFRYDHAVRGLNQYRGQLAAQCRYAEVFRYIDAQPVR